MRSHAPTDRLTRICDAMVDTFNNHPEVGGAKCIIMLQDGKDAGLVLNGYDNDTEALADLLIHVRAIFRANGKEMFLVAEDGVVL